MHIVCGRKTQLAAFSNFIFRSILRHKKVLYCHNKIYNEATLRDIGIICIMYFVNLELFAVITVTTFCSRNEGLLPEMIISEQTTN